MLSISHLWIYQVKWEFQGKTRHWHKYTPALSAGYRHTYVYYQISHDQGSSHKIWSGPVGQYLSQEHLYVTLYRHVARKTFSWTTNIFYALHQNVKEGSKYACSCFILGLVYFLEWWGLLARPGSYTLKLVHHLVSHFVLILTTRFIAYMWVHTPKSGLVETGPTITVATSMMIQ